MNESSSGQHVLTVQIPGVAKSAYPVVVGPNAFTQIPERVVLGNYSRIFIISDETVAKHWGAELQSVLGAAAEVVLIGAGEKYKTIATMEEVWGQLLRGKADRKSLIFNLGGGVVGDLGGFAASCYMRGIDFVQLPTTLLSQVDASVGGKVGVDFLEIKNLLGSFQQPKAVFCDTRTLKTLPEREFRAGFAEMVKHGLIADQAYFERTVAKKAYEYSAEELSSLIFDSIKIKAAVVEKDEREGGPRKILNFGHTIGHAIEAALLETEGLLHGEAISIGMLAEARLSLRMKIFDALQLERIEQGLLRVGLPTKLQNKIDIDCVLQKISHDKKNTGGRTKWVLLNGLGQAIVDQEVPEGEVRAVIASLADS